MDLIEKENEINQNKIGGQRIGNKSQKRLNRRSSQVKETSS